MINLFLKHKFFLQAAIISSCLLLWGCENDDAAISEWTQKVVLTEEAKAFIADKGYDSQFGARPLHRAIQKYLEDPLAEEILNMNIKSGDVLEAGLDKEAGKITFTLKDSVEEQSKAS